MPYNTTAIPPRRDVTGQTQLPLARVKKIIALDQDIAMCSNNAAFVITIATEMFIQYMAEQGHNVVKSERKPRRNIQYRDLANSVARQDSLEFLVDVVPRTIPYKAIKDRKAPASKDPAAAGPAASSLPTNGESSSAILEAGQTTLDHRRPQQPLVNGSRSNGHPASEEKDGDETEDAGDNEGDEADGADDPDAQLRAEFRGRTSGGQVVGDGDVEMS